MKRVLIILASLIQSCALSGWILPTHALSQTGSKGSSQPTELAISQDEFEQLASELQSTTYATRQLAIWRLRNLGDESVPVISALLQNASPDLSRLLIRTLGEFAANPNTAAGAKAVNVIRSIRDNEVGFRAESARDVLEAVGKFQSQQVESDLLMMGAIIPVGSPQILTVKNIHAEKYLIIDDRFQGAASDLRNVRWLEGIELVILRGRNINAEHFRVFSKMPSLRNLQIMDADLENKDLEPLREYTNLEKLEFIYSSVDNSAIQHLAGLPVWEAMRLFGTEMDREGYEQLVALQPDIDIIFGYGGYLGISSSTGLGTQVREVIPGGAAEQFGVLQGDIIRRVNGVEVREFADLQQELAKHRAGERIEIELTRITNAGPTEVTLDVELGKQYSLN